MADIKDGSSGPHDDTVIKAQMLTTPAVVFREGRLSAVVKLTIHADNRPPSYSVSLVDDRRAYLAQDIASLDSDDVESASRLMQQAAIFLNMRKVIREIDCGDTNDGC